MNRRSAGPQQAQVFDSRITRSGLLDYLEAEFFDDGVGEDVAGDAFDLGDGFFAGEAVEREDEEFSLADVFDFGVAERGEGALDGLSLGIEDGGFGHDPDVGFHRGDYRL